MMRCYPIFAGERILNPGQLLKYADKHNTPREFWGRANSYRCPLGVEAGEGWILMLRRDLNKLNLDAPLHHLTWFYGDKEIKFPLVVLDTTCMNISLPGKEDAAHLVHLADKRHLLKMAVINKAYNVRSDEGEETYFEDTRDGVSDWTWQTLLNDLWGELPSGAAAGDAPTLPYEPDGTPENLEFVGVSAWHAIGEVLSYIGCSVSYNPVNDTFDYIRLSEPQAELEQERESLENRRLYDYDPQVSNASISPEKILVYFRKVNEDNLHFADYKSPAHVIEKTSGIAGAVAGTTRVVWDPMMAIVDGDGEVTNSSELDTRATQVASNISGKFARDTLSRVHYSGLVDKIVPGADVGEVTWRDYGTGGLVTEVLLRREPLRTDRLPQGIPDWPWRKSGGNVIEAVTDVTCEDGILVIKKADVFGPPEEDEEEEV